MDELQSYNKNQIKQYSRFRINLIADKNCIEVSREDRQRIIEAMVGGAKYISLGNIFFATSSLASILPISDITDQVVYEPNRLLAKGGDDGKL